MMYNFHTNFKEDRVRKVQDYAETNPYLMDELELLTIKFKDAEECKTFTYNILTNLRAVEHVFNVLKCSPMMKVEDNKATFIYVPKDISYLYEKKDYVFKDEGKELTFSHKPFTVKRDSSEVALGRNYHKMLFDRAMIYMPALGYEELFNLMGYVIGNLPFLRDSYINSSRISDELKDAFLNIRKAAEVYREDIPSWYNSVFDQKIYDKLEEEDKDAFF